MSLIHGYLVRTWQTVPKPDLIGFIGIGDGALPPSFYAHDSADLD